MQSVQFIRTTHDQNGRWHPFPPAATAFWQQHGGVIGIQLRPEQPLSFAQLLIGCNEYADEHITDGIHPERNRGYVAWVLVHLLQLGMAAITTPSPIQPLTGLDWEAVYPPIARV